MNIQTTRKEGIKTEDKRVAMVEGSAEQERRAIDRLQW